MPITIYPVPPQAVTINPQPLAPNAAQEIGGQLQKIADTMELVLLELRVLSTLFSQINDPIQDDPDQIRSDPTLLS